MKILVDTSIWSLILRRKNPDEEITDQFKHLLNNDERIFLLGVILQEILTGIKEKVLFDSIADHLSAFPIIDLARDDYVSAAKLASMCRQKGITASTIDFLIASVCIERDLLLYSVDKDFQLIAEIATLKVIENYM